MTGPWFVDALTQAHAAEAGADPAILDGSTSWSWADLDRRVDSLADALARGGVGPGAHVAVLAAPSGPTVVGLLAILRAGAVAAPMPGGLTEPELVAAMALVQPTIVLCDDASAASSAAAVAAASSAAAVAGRPGPVLLSLDRGAGPGGPVPSVVGPAVTRAATDPAIVVLTSGTTGRPKAVVLSASALAASADAWLGALPPTTGWVLALGLGHVAGLGVLWRAIAARVPTRIVPANDPGALLAALRADPPPSHVSLVPAQLVRVLDLVGDAPPPPSLRAVLLGAGPIPSALVERAVHAGWPVAPTYGLSEAGSGVTVLPTAEAARHPSSAGRPLPGMQVRIQDPDRAGVGEILAQTPARFLAYLGDALGTAAAVDAAGWLRTGDLGRLDAAGRLTVADRRVDRIVRGGQNIAPAEVEAVLAAHPAIAAAAVVGRSDALWGHVPVAAIVLRDATVDPGDEALVRHCRASLAGFKVPVTFVRLPALPRTAGGKVRRHELRDRIAARPTDVAREVSPTRLRWLAREDGVRIAWHEIGDGPLPIILLHGTLSHGRQLAPLASALARPGGVRVLAVDRRGSGASRLSNPAPLDVGVHVEDLLAILDAESIQGVVAVGISYGGVLALELAARHPDRVLAVVAWEPPYRPLASPAEAVRLLELGAATVAAHRTGGPARAAEVFLRGVAGDAAWDRLSPRARAVIEGEGDGALADVLLSGLDPDGLARISGPVAVLTGDASESFYDPIADALVGRIPGAWRIRLARLGHAGPILDPSTVATAVHRALAEAGVLSFALRLGPAASAR